MRSQHIRVFCCWLALLGLWPAMGHAAPADTEAAAVLAAEDSATAEDSAAEVVLVTAVRGARAESSLPFGGLALDAAAIRRSQARSLEELLDGLPGISMASSGGHGSLTSLFLRGAESDHSLVLVDGVQVNSLASDTASLQFLNPRQLARVEVLRGPRSALYGSQGIGGVLHLLSEEPALAAGARSAPEAQVTHYLGSLGLLGTTLSSRYADRAGRESHWSASAERTDGIDRAEQGSADADGADLYALRYGLRGGEADGAWRLSAALRRGRGEYDEFSQYDALNTVREWQAQAGWRGQFAEVWEWQVRASGFRSASDSDDSSAPLSSRSDRRVLSWQMARQSGGGEWRFGMDLTGERYHLRDTALARNHRDIAAGYALWSRSLGDHLLEAAARWDRSDTFGSELSKSLAWSWDLGAWRWRLGYGEGFKLPSFVDLYQNFAAFSFYANPDLEAERSRGAEMGLRYRSARLDVELSLFDLRMRDLIGVASEPRGLTLANMARARSRGAELSQRWSFGPAELAIAATWLDAKNLGDGLDLLSRPAFNGRAELSWRRETWSMALELAGRRDWREPGSSFPFQPVDMPGFALLNWRWERRFLGRYALRASLDNLTGRDYRLRDGFHMPGRQFSLGVQYNL